MTTGPSASINKYLQENLQGLADPSGEDDDVLGNTLDFLATRIAYKLDCKGPALTVQSGCSSGLACVHEARISLLTKQADIALAAAVSLSAPHNSGYEYSNDGIRSQDGFIRPFDAKASGTVFTNGIAVLVLKRLPDAIADNDNILGVIASSALNNDGINKASFTSPSCSQQAKVISKAVRLANAPLDQMAMIEAHGTGTAIGAPIEFQALQQAFYDYYGHNSCALQSVKANIGHLDTASGIAGIIKSMLILQNKTLPPQINYSVANPALDLADSPFFINTKAQALAQEKNFIGVTALGIGGTNAHVVLQSVDCFIEKSENTLGNAGLLLTSAKTESSLKQIVANISQNAAEIYPADLAYSSQVGRTHFEVRTANLITSSSDIKALGKTAFSSSLASDNIQQAWMFSGQGAQYNAMAIDLYNHCPRFKAKFAENLTILREITGDDFFAIWQCSEKINNPLYKTQNTQPMLLALECALAAYLQDLGMMPDVLIGHSLGEYSALVVAEVLSFADAAKLVVKRAALMANSPAGAMCSAVADKETILSLIAEKQLKIEIAAHNGPNIYTVSGNAQDIDAFIELSLEYAIFAQKLPTEKGFHSFLLEDILPEYKSEVEKIKFKSPKIAIISNRTGQPLTDEQISDPNYWCQQLRGAVEFATGVNYINENYQAVFVEVGPGTTLTTLAERNINDKIRCINTLPHPKAQQSSYESFLLALGKLWQAGAEVNWPVLHDGFKLKRVPYPGYQFAEKSCWLKPSINNKRNKNNLASYKAFWRADFVTAEYADKKNTALYCLSTNNKLADDLLTSCSQDYNNQHYFNLNEMLDGKEYCLHKFIKLITTAKDAAANYQIVIINDKASPERILILLTQALMQVKSNNCTATKFITDRAIYFQTQHSPDAAALPAAIKAVRQEYSGTKASLLDADFSETWQAPATAWLKQENAKPVMVLRRDTLFTEDFMPIEMVENLQHKPMTGTAVLLGGTGQVGLQYTQALLETTDLSLALLQRSPVDTIKHPVNQRQQAKAEAITRLQQQYPNRVEVYQTDIADLTELCTTLEQINGQITALIHTAGIDASMHYKLLSEVDAKFYQQCFYAKRQGLQTMAAVAGKFSIEHCHVISSISSTLAGVGMTVYGALHSYIDSQVDYLDKTHSSNWSAINWEAWEFNNTEDEPAQFQQGAFGSHLDSLAISPAVGREIICKFWRSSTKTMILSSSDLKERYENWVLGEITDDNQSQEIKDQRPELQTEYQAPRNEIERKLEQVWSNLLAIDKIGIKDNFFALGGHSLLAIKFISILKKELAREISIVDLFANSSIESLAAMLSPNKKDKQQDTKRQQRAKLRKQRIQKQRQDKRSEQ